MKNKIVGYVVLCWRFGPSPLVYAGRYEKTQETPPKALFNPCGENGTIFETRMAASAAIKATEKFRGQQKDRRWDTIHHIVPVTKP